MNDDNFGYFILTVLMSSVVVAFVASLFLKKGTTFWATKLMLIGSSALLLAGSFSTIWIIIENLGPSPILNSAWIQVSLGICYLLGMLLFSIGLFGFCARWGAAGRRRAELHEITAALSATQKTTPTFNSSQVSSSSSLTPPPNS